MSDDGPAKSMRIRFDNGNESRRRSIESAAELYDCNRTDAVSYACNDVAELVGAIREVLRRDDLTLEQRREIAAAFDEATRGLEVAVDETATVRADR